MNVNKKELDNYFKDYLKKEPLFKDKKALQSIYTPKNVPFRDEQINQIAGILAPSLRLERPSNIFVYGKTGSGKTLSVKHVAEHLDSVAKNKNINLKIVYINCKLKKVADTEYRVLAQLLKEFGKDVPATGLPTDEIYKHFIKCIEEKEQLIILVLDEIDQLVNKIGDEILYNFTRLNSELKKGEISLVGISNSLVFTDNLDPRVKSSLSEEEIVFPPYNALQLQKILKQRADIAFRGNVVDEGVIEKCAAYAAREHGDARRALELLRVAGELAERSNDSKISIKYIDDAQDKIEKDRIIDVVNTQPKQFQLTLYSIILKCTENNDSIFTGDIYETYRHYCVKCGIKPLTQRRVFDIINELSMMGIINARVISKGRYGRSNKINLAITHSILPKIQQILKEGLSL